MVTNFLKFLNVTDLCLCCVSAHLCYSTTSVLQQFIILLSLHFLPVYSLKVSHCWDIWASTEPCWPWAQWMCPSIFPSICQSFFKITLQIFHYTPFSFQIFGHLLFAPTGIVALCSFKCKWFPLMCLFFYNDFLDHLFL